MDSLSKLSDLFMKFPGIGPRQARRFVYFLLREDDRYRSELVRLVAELSTSVAQCALCGRFFERRVKADVAECPICSDPRREKSVLMVVEKDADLEVVERSGCYRGRYFVLGGTLPLTESTALRWPRLASLKEKIAERDELKEIVLALSLTTEGEHTASLLTELLREATEQNHVKLSTLGRGLSSGLEIEYSDPETLRQALESRRNTLTERKPVQK
ncbi:MAG: toprim domain-containing protein [bacterium]|nr:toprim domain-containing protein [bacterium]MDZ4284625.1 toprim domain-containing protein [Patescibacteria group bacterium]